MKYTPGKHSFSGGIFLPQLKEHTAQLVIEPMPPPATLIIPLLQHNGPAATVCVKHGDPVRIGDVLAEGESAGAVAVHASVSGTVASIGEYIHPCGRNQVAVEITNDTRDDTVNGTRLLDSWREMNPAELIRFLCDQGIVESGLCARSALQIFTVPTHRPVETVVINALDLQPYSAASIRLCLEKTEEILLGSLIIKKITGANKVIIAVSRDRQDIINAVSRHLDSKTFHSCSLTKLAPRYPQDDDALLTRSLFGIELDTGTYPMDAGFPVFDISTMHAVWEAVYCGRPLVERVITVAGEGVRKPRNLRVRIGTPISHILRYCDVDFSAARKVIMNGPMRGITIADMDAPVIKTTSGLTVLCHPTPAVQSNACINCSHCVKACPMRLVPAHLVRLVDHGQFSQAAQWNIERCIECGTCSYVCPSKVNIVQRIQLGKQMAGTKTAAPSTAVKPRNEF